MSEKTEQMFDPTKTYANTDEHGTSTMQVAAMNLWRHAGTALEDKMRYQLTLVPNKAQLEWLLENHPDMFGTVAAIEDGGHDPVAKLADARAKEIAQAEEQARQMSAAHEGSIHHPDADPRAIKLTMELAQAKQQEEQKPE